MSSWLDHREERAESVSFAAQEVLDAGERIAFDWLELLRAEWTERARSFARRSALAVAGAALLVCAWVFASAAVVVGLDRHFTLEASLCAVAAAHGALGASLFVKRRRRHER